MASMDSGWLVHWNTTSGLSLSSSSMFTLKSLPHHSVPVWAMAG